MGQTGSVVRRRVVDTSRGFPADFPEVGCEHGKRLDLLEKTGIGHSRTS